MIYRERYIEKIREHYDSDTVKIITGIRGAGKSVMLGQIMGEIRERSDNLLHLDFEDRRVSASIKNGAELVEYARDNRGEGLYYLFLDEPQELDGWQEACRILRDEGCSIFIVGSDRRVVSGELIDAIDGRYVSVTVCTFTYREIKECAAELGRDAAVDDYLAWGGFPGRFAFDSRKEQEKYLDALDARVIDEIVYRYKIRKEALFRGVADFVISSRGRIFSAKAIHGHVAKKYGECSVNTVMKYLEYLEGAYVISSVRQYSSRENRELKFYTKLYNADVALSTLRRGEGAAELSCDIENTVYRELIFMGYSVVAYTCRSGEVDFLASRGNKKFFVQTAYSVADVNVRKRAFGAFREIDNLSQKILITCDNEDYSTSAVRHIAFKDFLLMTSLDAWECERYERYERYERHARPVASIREDPIASEVKRAPRKRPEPKPVETEAVDIKPAADIAQPKPKKKDISVYLL